MKAKELRELTSEQLTEKLNEFKSELFSLRSPISYWSVNSDKHV